MTLQQILAFIESIFAGYQQYQAGQPATLAPQRLTFAGLDANVGLTVQKASAVNPPADALRFDNTADMLRELETAFTDYAEYQSGGQITVPPIVARLGGDEAAFVFTIQRADASATAAPQQPQATAQSIRASMAAGAPPPKNGP